jgi:hypothetical protein
MLIECEFDHAMELAMKMAESLEAIYLPGWRLRTRFETYLPQCSLGTLWRPDPTYWSLFREPTR